MSRNNAKKSGMVVYYLENIVSFELPELICVSFKVYL